MDRSPQSAALRFAALLCEALLVLARKTGLKPAAGRRQAVREPLSRWHLWMAGACGALAAVLVAASAQAQSPPLPEKDWTRTESRADCSSYSALRNPYFGDLHVHTKYSADAVLIRVRNSPRDAYAFALGGEVGLPPYDAFDVPARTATIDRNLDFTAVTDHAEGFGEAVICLTPGYPGYDDPVCTDLRDTFDNIYEPEPQPPQAFMNFFLPLNAPDPERFPGVCGAGDADCLTEAAVVWNDTLDAAEQYYDRSAACSFTTFNAYEWSSNLNQSNLHRNVIFRNERVPAMPISYYEEGTPESLWAALELQCLDAGTGCDVLAIPHNSNIGTDMMFSRSMSNGDAMTVEYATKRASMEPLVEVMQNKGDSECRDGIGDNNDELCSFEKLSRTTLIGPSNWRQQFSPRAYTRFALREGLYLEKKIGVQGLNPFRFGFVGGTDTHNGTPGKVAEAEHGASGHMGISESEPRYILNGISPPGKIEGNGGGLTVLWAEENSRDALFAAMRRRETYSTSGTRPLVRVFAGRFGETLCDDPDWVAEGYDKGVPMGGELGPVLGKKSPRILVWAQKDAGTLDQPGAQLQRLQIIKGWIDKDNNTRELVYDIAGNADNGAGVDLATCTPTGTGADELCAVWEDPKFDATQNAFYYARVVENPTCRWSTYLCNELDVDCSDLPSVPANYVMCCDSHVPRTIQERAVTSPIWYRSELAGLSKGAVKFGGDAGTDRLQLKLLFGEAPAELDPEVSAVTITLSNAGGVVHTATIPAGTMEVKKAGSKYLYKDPAGSLGGITGMTVKIAGKGSAQIIMKTGDVDLSAIDPSTQTLAVDVAIGTTYSATDRHEWELKGTTLKAVF